MQFSGMPWSLAQHSPSVVQAEVHATWQAAIPWMASKLDCCESQDQQWLCSDTDGWGFPLKYSGHGEAQGPALLGCSVQAEIKQGS